MYQKEAIGNQKTRSQPKCANFTDDQFRPVDRKQAAKIKDVHETNQDKGTHNVYEELEVQSIPDQVQEYDGNYKCHSRNKPKLKTNKQTNKQTNKKQNKTKQNK